jgi:hypothetical protein
MLGYPSGGPVAEALSTGNSEWIPRGFKVPTSPLSTSPLSATALPSCLCLPSTLIMSLPKTMRGLRLEEFNKPYVYHTDLPVPTPRPGELILKIKAAGFCHTETVAMAVSL